LHGPARPDRRRPGIDRRPPGSLVVLPARTDRPAVRRSVDDPADGDAPMTPFPSRLSLPYDLGDLLLTPQWAGLPAGLRFGLIALVCVVPLALVLWLYRWELRLVSRVTATALLGLRTLVLLLLLALVCLQPVHARDKTFGLPGRVLVAVDRSDS